MIKYILVIFVVLICFLTEEMYRYVFRSRPSALFNMFYVPRGHEDNYYIVRDEKKAVFEKAYNEEFEIKGHKGETLKGFYYPLGSEGKKIVFVVHGYRSEHNETAGMLYEFYKSQGIDMFCCDHTAHGKSEGKYIGFDMFETEDCLKWVEFLVNKFGEDTEIFLHGFSMGGATVMKMSSYCPPNVKFIIEDSGFKNAFSSLDHQVGPMYEPLRLINRICAGYDLNDSDVTESLLKSEIPMLFVHGRDDKLVPFANGPELYSMYRGEKDFFFPEGTRHIESIYTEPEVYAEKIKEFMVKYL